MTERMNMLRITGPDKQADAPAPDPWFDISESRRRSVFERFTTLTKDRDLTISATSLLRDMQVLFQGDNPTFTEAQWLKVIEKLRMDESTLFTSPTGRANYFRSVANAKLAYPRGVYVLSKEAEELLEAEVSDYRGGAMSMFLFRAGSAAIIKPDACTLSPEEADSLKEELQHDLERLMAKMNKKKNVQAFMNAFFRNAADMRLLDPSFCPHITAQEWQRIHKELEAVAKSDSFPTGYLDLAANIAIVRAEKVKLTDKGLKLTFDSDHSEGEEIPPMPAIREV